MKLSNSKYLSFLVITAIEVNVRNATFHAKLVRGQEEINAWLVLKVGSWRQENVIPSVPRASLNPILVAKSVTIIVKLAKVLDFIIKKNWVWVYTKQIIFNSNTFFFFPKCIFEALYILKYQIDTFDAYYFENWFKVSIWIIWNFEVI